MMIGPETYLKQIKDKSYEELLEEKRKLIEKINNFENSDNIETIFFIDPSPEVQYQCNLEYLAKLCTLLAEKYRDSQNSN